MEAHNLFYHNDGKGGETWKKVPDIAIALDDLCTEFENFCLAQGYRLPENSHIGVVTND